MKEFNLKKYIRDLQSKDHTLLSKLAEIAGHTSTSPIIKWLDNPHRELDNFCSLLLIVRHLFPQKENEIMSRYSLLLDPNKKAARYMLEYLSTHRLLEPMQLLLDKMGKESYKKSQEWVEVYSVLYELQLNYRTLDKEEYLRKIIKIKVNDPKLNFLLNSIKAYMYFIKGNHKMSNEIIKVLAIKFEDLKDSYVKNSYYARLNESLAYLNLWVLNDNDAARKNASIVLESNIGKQFDAQAYFTLGYSYYFTSYDKAEEYILKSIDMYNRIGFTETTRQIEEGYERLKIYWGKKQIDEPFLTVENELLFRALRKEDISDDLQRFGGDIDEARRNFILGVSKDDVDLLLLSMIQYLKNGNTLYANVPMNELKKINYNPVILNELINVHR
ncbi:hypothetical protein BAOM_3020 [Peribacillus asahii]|uniref:Uncharacterized protein n=1 Tax=Peribacillus asahii TaxID=228899 RepID=A0A3T0KT62_9BACI|nr:AimR family lysis-lysogeny pheromone receptor [Peribacillus asahii]AZV43629.1 hypothetical protein BAOM_3020 [Peribacillus asahii]